MGVGGGGFISYRRQQQKNVALFPFIPSKLFNLEITNLCGGGCGGSGGCGGGCI
jgi:hypothetical protein